MTVLSDVIQRYDTGKHIWLQGAYGEVDREANSDRVPRLCPVGALWELGPVASECRSVEYALHTEAQRRGYPTFYRYNDASDRTLDQVLAFMRGVETAMSERV